MRERLTVGVVVVFAAACLARVAATLGVRAAAVLLAVTAVPGFVSEVVGVNTGVPFGSYDYSHALGPQLFGVPLVIGLAWTMLAWPAAVVASRLVDGLGPRIVVGALATTAGDLFLDPQMVFAGAWTWHTADSGAFAYLPGVPDVPLTNLLGWVLVSLLLSALVQTVLRPGPDAFGLAVYVWFWSAWTLALAVFLPLRAAAAWGFVGMGAFALPALVGAVRARRA
ncbi:carotenoid biosynthesis protein [Jatrophihabitans fulvus]